MAQATQPKATQADYAYGELKRMMLDGTLQFGAQMLEAEAATRLGVSRTPVREAMIRLQQEGMVELRPRHGMRVLPVSADDMRDIYDVLTALEGKAAELVAQKRPDEAALAGLWDAVDQMERALAAEDLDGWADADERFHMLLIELTDNARLVSMVNQLRDQAHRARMATLRLRPPPEASNREHRALVEAIASGNPAEARRTHEEHRHRAKALLVNILQNLGGSYM
ncbi:transcriptional regulator, GntR family protein [Oceanicola granulosus HTCC2516]|uniref:Transcriptional regulator, GntR family protein n=1 Tax=Oceanicola granulosus (strain ATCC BAA-861 / DSM 15982 / KCTC 12143 / HTCC2516) TaxID=314256 RepID=Q2CF12_OCEGH|nr:GntR family transcriptional regulator [Oceanicola granulosus]EAR51315.1 transcriptional regulator, GntR family protein [Oceanicola granulosus HTCC2516]